MSGRVFRSKQLHALNRRLNFYQSSRGAEQGYVLLIVLVLLLFISSLTASMLAQTQNDSVLPSHSQRNAALWRASDLGMARVSSALLMDVDTPHLPSWLYRVVNQMAVDGMRENTAVQLSGCIAPSQPFISDRLMVQSAQGDRHAVHCDNEALMILGYATRLPVQHYLTKAYPYTIPKLPYDTQELAPIYLHLTFYVIAAESHPAACASITMQKMQRLQCYAQAGVATRASASELLAIVYADQEEPTVLSANNINDSVTADNRWSDLQTAFINNDQTTGQQHVNWQLSLLKPLRWYDVRMAGFS